MRGPSRQPAGRGHGAADGSAELPPRVGGFDLVWRDGPVPVSTCGALQVPGADKPRTPFTAIDHLHLHALQAPFARLVDEHITFREGAPWCASLEAAEAAALARRSSRPRGNG